MPNLKLRALLDDKPVKLTVELPAQLHRDLETYAKLLGQQTGRTLEPVKLIAPMLMQFISTDRSFTKARRSNANDSKEFDPAAS